MKYRFANRENRLAFGPFPTVTLAMAREQRTEAQRLLREKVDPSEYKKQAKRAAKVAAANSFEAVAREWFAKFSPKWAETHSCKVLLRLENDLIPWLGSRPISGIEAGELLVTIRRVAGRRSHAKPATCVQTRPSNARKSSESHRRSTILCLDISSAPSAVSSS